MQVAHSEPVPSLMFGFQKASFANINQEFKNK